jgi:hypothetical protein
MLSEKPIYERVNGHMLERVVWSIMSTSGTCYTTTNVARWYGMPGGSFREFPAESTLSTYMMLSIYSTRAGIARTWLYPIYVTKA